MNKIRLGVIGAGNMGQKHIGVLKEFYNLIDFIGFFDTDSNTCQKVASKYHVKSFIDLETFLTNIDAVIIAAPTCFHFHYGMICAQRYKHIFVEKPICEDETQAQDLIHLCKKNHLILQVGHIERFNPVIQELPKILENEKIISLDFRRLSPYDHPLTDTDVVHDLMIHDLDMMYFLVSKNVESIQAQGSSIYTKNSTDYAQALIKFMDQTLVSLTASRITEDKVRMLIIHTQKAYIRIDYLNKIITLSRRTHFKLQTGYHIEYQQENIIEKVHVRLCNALKEQDQSFIHAIKNHSLPKVTGEDGLKALRLADHITYLITHEKKVAD